MPYHLFDIKQNHQYYKQSVCGPKLVPQFQAIVIVIRSAPIYALVHWIYPPPRNRIVVWLLIVVWLVEKNLIYKSYTIKLRHAGPEPLFPWSPAATRPGTSCFGGGCLSKGHWSVAKHQRTSLSLDTVSNRSGGKMPVISQLLHRNSHHELQEHLKLIYLIYIDLLGGISTHLKNVLVKLDDFPK